MLPKEGPHPSCNSLTRALSTDSLASQIMANLAHDIHCHYAWMTPLRPGYAVLPMALFLSMWFSFSASTIMVAEAATFEPSTVDSSTLVDENNATEDDPDPNQVPLDTEGPPPEATNPPTSTTSSVPRVEDLLLLNPAGNSPATARFSDTLNPPAELAQTQNPSQNAADQTEYANYNVPIVMDSSVQAHIRYFNTAIHGRFEQWLFRLSRYQPLVETIFTEFHLPSDLVYLSLVESGFNPYAYSRAKATGPWQFT